ncbi:hypothetical protein CapIbe_010729 [Capra ibex]
MTKRCWASVNIWVLKTQLSVVLRPPIHAPAYTRPEIQDTRQHGGDSKVLLSTQCLLTTLHNLPAASWCICESVISINDVLFCFVLDYNEEACP